jgi:uncharacterized iron-regulated membrane protein
MTLWQRWVRQPQSVFLRKALFQVHLWTGIGLGLYVVVICLSGSVLVYRTELHSAFSPEPVIVAGAGVPLSIEQLTSAARRVYPGYEIAAVRIGKTANHAAEITVEREGRTTRRLFHPFNGADLGDPVPVGYRLTTWLLDLHDNLLAGETGRHVNGVGAIGLIVLCLTGAIIWWPGLGSWRRSLTVDLRAHSRRLTWSLHSAFGFWSFAFLFMWGVTGVFLSFQPAIAAVFDLLEPFDASSSVERVVDRIQYWLAYLHFGRLGGRGIPGCGRGLCNSITKGAWAAFGLVPPLLFVTGGLMWWNRVLRHRAR